MADEHIRAAFGDLTPLEAGYLMTKQLEPGKSCMAFEPFGQDFIVPAHNTLTALFRRYEELPVDLEKLTMLEGVLPEAGTFSTTDIIVNLFQLGGWIPYTDLIEDAMTDPVVQRLVARQGQQCCEAIEKNRALGFMGANSVFYPGSALARDEVTAELGTALVDRIVAWLWAMKASPVTSVVRSTVEYGRVSIPHAFIGFAHPYVEPAVRDLTGFKGIEDYGTLPAWDMEIGFARGVRWMRSNALEAWVDAGGAAGSMRSTSGSNADVFPVIIMGEDYFGKVSHKLYPAKNADAKGQMLASPVSPIIVKPRAAPGNWLGQLGSVGWKTLTAFTLLNQLFGCKVEVAARY